MQNIENWGDKNFENAYKEFVRYSSINEQQHSTGRDDGNSRNRSQLMDVIQEVVNVMVEVVGGLQTIKRKMKASVFWIVYCYSAGLILYLVDVVTLQ